MADPVYPPVQDNVPPYPVSDQPPAYPPQEAPPQQQGVAVSFVTLKPPFVL